MCATCMWRGGLACILDKISVHGTYASQSVNLYKIGSHSAERYSAGLTSRKARATKRHYHLDTKIVLLAATIIRNTRQAHTGITGLRREGGETRSCLPRLISCVIPELNITPPSFGTRLIDVKATYRLWERCIVPNVPSKRL